LRKKPWTPWPGRELRARLRLELTTKPRGGLRTHLEILQKQRCNKHFLKGRHRVSFLNYRGGLTARVRLGTAGSAKVYFSLQTSTTKTRC
jgi:hypothetical protein